MVPPTDVIHGDAAGKFGTNPVNEQPTPLSPDAYNKLMPIKPIFLKFYINTISII